MSLVITSLYAGLIALLFIALSVRVVRYRRGNRVSVGHQGHKDLEQRMRAQANCGEYAPMGLILLLISEIQGAPPVALHVLGIMLVAGRIMHAIGFSKHPQIMGLRVGGMVLTFSMIVFTALGLLAHALF
ncbi:Inner membrane protein YecN [Ascidiaceihabitans donghaensis]|uniref:Inner membrane protein YecN n=1 Tax=Ascidiaceihabitans donghaensis TaxID=1510460 RepID=A0A2R8BFL3_9RHOB|nr:MAPEG family protein [Ascidiaceihabitans donghaensis]SPH21846.1 Inner membrane protein YecN [Ascidiaceihabitans donghaensis]